MRRHDTDLNLFEECLADWELDGQWRPVVERLAERVADWPSTAPEPAEFCVEAPLDAFWRDGLFVWVDLDGACLGAQVDGAGLRYGHLNQVPGNGRDTWFTSCSAFPRDDRSLATLADEILDWMAREAARLRRARDEPPGRASATR